MKWVVLGRILIVIGIIYPALVITMLISSLTSEVPMDINWVLFTICFLVGMAGFMIEDKGKKQRKITNGQQQLK